MKGSRWDLGFVLVSLLPLGCGSSFHSDGFAEQLRSGCNELTCEKVAARAEERATRCAEDEPAEACVLVQQELAEARFLLARSRLVVGRDVGAEKRAEAMRQAALRQERAHKQATVELLAWQREQDARAEAGRQNEQARADSAAAARVADLELLGQTGRKTLLRNCYAEGKPRACTPLLLEMLRLGSLSAAERNELQKFEEQLSLAALAQRD